MSKGKSGSDKSKSQPKPPKSDKGRFTGSGVKKGKDGEVKVF